MDESNAMYSAITSFQARTGNVIGYLAGHTHMDNNAVSGGIQFITQTAGVADKQGDRGQTNANISTTDHENNAWSIFKISTSDGFARQYRFGWDASGVRKNSWNFTSD